MKRVVIGLVAAIVIGGLLFFFVGPDSTDKNSEVSPTRDTQQTSEQQPKQPVDSEQSAEDQTKVNVSIEGFAFSPATLTIKKGTTVTWTNKDSVQHDVMPDAASNNAFKGSELLSNDESYSFTFNETGTFAYHCTPHPQMKAQIIVE